MPLTSSRKTTVIELPCGTGIRPPLKWAGGKRWLVPQIKKLYESSGNNLRLVEPFCGGLAVTLGIQPIDAVLNDINKHSINFYHWLRRGLQSKLPMKNEEDYYYSSRENFNKLLEKGLSDSKAAAELFYYLNRTGYNGLCRFNKKGLFNVPFGRYKKINYTSDFTPYKDVLRNWHFIQGDFELIPTSANDFIYADPPYDVEFRQYSKEGFNWKDQVRLAHWLARFQGPVVASNQATERIVELYDSLGFQIKILDAPRMISCTGDRSKAKEMLAIKNIKAI